MVEDKIFLIISNLYFFNQLMEMQVDFSDACHSVPVLDFTDVFLIGAVTP
jgi:hypothetical protein